MRKYIKGKVYDTATAELICETPQGHLYRKNSSISFFLLSRNGLIITPISWSGAREQIRKHGTLIQYRELFEPAPTKERTNVDMDKQTYSMLRNLAGERGMTVKGYLRRMIRDRYKGLNYRRKNK